MRLANDLLQYAELSIVFKIYKVLNFLLLHCIIKTTIPLIS